jgi:hypothetical protein
MTLEKIILVMVSWCFYNTITSQILKKKFWLIFKSLILLRPPRTKKCDMPDLKDYIALE